MNDDLTPEQALARRVEQIDVCAMSVLETLSIVRLAALEGLTGPLAGAHASMALDEIAAAARRMEREATTAMSLVIAGSVPGLRISVSHGCERPSPPLPPPSLRVVGGRDAEPAR